MGLFGPSKSRLKDRIDTLEEKVEDAQERAETAERRAENAIETAQDIGGVSREIAVSLAEMHADASELEDKEDVVEKIDESKIVWKATRMGLTKLLLPEGTTVVHPVYCHKDHKKRSNQAVVLGFYDLTEFDRPTDEDKPSCRVTDNAINAKGFTYEIGETVEPESRLDIRTEIECTSGIHFFCTRESAEYWYRHAIF